MENFLQKIVFTCSFASKYLTFIHCFMKALYILSLNFVYSFVNKYYFIYLQCFNFFFFFPPTVFNRNPIRKSLGNIKFSSPEPSGLDRASINLTSTHLPSSSGYWAKACLSAVFFSCEKAGLLVDGKWKLSPSKLSALITGMCCRQCIKFIYMTETFYMANRNAPTHLDIVHWALGLFTVWCAWKFYLQTKPFSEQIGFQL